MARRWPGEGSTSPAAGWTRAIRPARTRRRWRRSTGPRRVRPEGVETLEQATALRQLRCAFAQGFLFSRPVPATDIDRMLQAGLRR